MAPHSDAASPARPAFLITIDTEGDNLWSRPRNITTRNSAFLPRFQALCERYGLRPTWLTNYEMAMCPVYREFARDVLKRNAGEVGMHLHAWYSPPDTPLTDDDHKYQPFLIEYPDSVMREKVGHLTRLLEDTFQVPIRSHRAGRWAFDARYARILASFGYETDCSVAPTIDWSRTKGDPKGKGGSDYSTFPAEPYYVDSRDIALAGTSGLLEVPMTTDYAYPLARRVVPGALHVGPLRRLSRARAWLRPNGDNLREMVRLVDRGVRDGRAHLEFMLHSSEFMPGGSPTFPDEPSIERLYEDLDALFARAAARCVGMTLTEFGARWRRTAPI